MLKYLPLLCLLACGIDRDIPEVSDQEEEMVLTYAQLIADHKVQITESNELSEPLTLCLQFVDAQTKEPLINQRVHFYHADVTGEYRPAVPGNESTARLSGEASTDEKGRIFFRSTLPGDYGSSADNRHIHTTVFGARPEGYDIHFRQFTGFMGARFIAGSDQHFLAFLKKDSSNNLMAFLTIEVKNPKFLP